MPNVPYPYEVHGKLVLGSLIPISSLSNRSKFDCTYYCLSSGVKSCGLKTTPSTHSFKILANFIRNYHGLRTPREEIALTAQLRIQSQSQIFRYGRSIFCLPHQPNFSDIFDLCLHWVSVVRGLTYSFIFEKSEILHKSKFLCLN